MSSILNYVNAVLRELGMMVRNWDNTEWTIAFVFLVILGYVFLKGNAGKKSI